MQSSDINQRKVLKQIKIVKDYIKSGMWKRIEAD